MPKLGITRDQLAVFLKDHESIKAFERLFDTTESQSVDIDDADIKTSLAEAKALQALNELAAIRADFQIETLKPPAKEDRDYFSEFLAFTPPAREEKRKFYGSFYDTTTQNAAAINTAYAITFNSTDLSFGVQRGATTSQIFVYEPGVYNISFSAQLDNTSGGNHLVFVWLRVNGTNVANSASQIRLKGTDGELVAAWNFFYDFKSGDYFELMWSVSDVAVQITASAAVAPVPAIPSVILTVSNNID